MGALRAEEGNVQLLMTPLIVFFVALVVFIWTTYRAQSDSGRERARYQAMGVGAMLIAGVVGLVFQPGGLRYAWAALAVAALIRLILIQRQARARGASGTAAPGGG